MCSMLAVTPKILLTFSGLISLSIDYTALWSNQIEGSDSVEQKDV